MTHNLDFTPIWGLTYPDHFNLESCSIDSGPTLDVRRLIDEVIKADGNTRTGARYPNTHLNHALMLFHKLATDTAFDGIDPASLFAACCDTVLIWSFG